MSVITGLVGCIKKGDTSDTFTGTACTLGADNRTLSINDTDYKYLVPGTITVYKDDAEVSEGSYTMFVGGVLFNQDMGSGTYTMDGTYYDALEEIGGFYNFTINETVEALETTEFKCPYKTYVGGMASWKIDAEKFWMDEEYNTLINAKELVLVIAVIDDDNDKMAQGYALITQNETSIGHTGLLSEKITFTGSGKLVEV